MSLTFRCKQHQGGRHLRVEHRGHHGGPGRRRSTEVTVVALVDDEGILGDVLRVDLVGVQEVDELRLGRGRLVRRDEADVIRSRA